MSSQPQITYGYRVLHRVHCPSNRTWFQPDSRTLPSSMLPRRTQASGMISRIAGKQAKHPYSIFPRRSACTAPVGPWIPPEQTSPSTSIFIVSLSESSLSSPRQIPEDLDDIVELFTSWGNGRPECDWSYLLASRSSCPRLGSGSGFFHVVEGT